MKIRNIHAAGSKLAIDGKTVEVDKYGYVEVKEEIAQVLLAQNGWETADEAAQKAADAPKIIEPSPEPILEDKAVEIAEEIEKEDIIEDKPAEEEVVEKKRPKFARGKN